MKPSLFDYYRQTLEERFLEHGHGSLSQYFTSDLSVSVFTNFHRRAIKALSTYLPFDQHLIGNPYLMQGGGNYHVMEVNFASGDKAVIHTEHIYEHSGALPRPQKHGRLVDMMIRLNYLKTLPEYTSAEAYLVLVSDHVMVNYKDGFAFESKHISPDWVANQVLAFQQAIIPRFREHLHAVGVVMATQYIPVYTNPGNGFGMGVWQIT